MIYIAYRMSGDPSGYWDEYYTIDSHYDKITQKIIDQHTFNISIKDVLRLRWVERYEDNIDPYDAIAIFNDSVKHQTDYNKNLEDAVSEYRREMRNEKINQLLNEQ